MCSLSLRRNEKRIREIALESNDFWCFVTKEGKQVDENGFLLLSILQQWTQTFMKYIIIKASFVKKDIHYTNPGQKSPSKKLPTIKSPKMTCYAKKSPSIKSPTKTFPAIKSPKVTVCAKKLPAKKYLIIKHHVCYIWVKTWLSQFSFLHFRKMNGHIYRHLHVVLRQSVLLSDSCSLSTLIIRWNTCSTN